MQGEGAITMGFRLATDKLFLAQPQNDSGAKVEIVLPVVRAVGKFWS